MRPSVADWVSISRIVLAYPLYHMMATDVTFTLCLLFWMLLSDFLDGLLARRYGSTGLGVWLDPVADAICVLSWIWGLWGMNVLTWHWIAFWLMRYVFFVSVAMWRRWCYGYCIPAGLWNKISIVFLVLFLFDAWWYRAISPSLGVVSLLCQVLSMAETLLAPLQANDQSVPN